MSPLRQPPPHRAGFDRALDRFAERVYRRLRTFLPKAIDEARLRTYVGAPTWEHEPAAYNATFSAPIWDLLERKGKCWRPLFVVLLLEALGKRARPYELLLYALTELPHTGALIIDDIEDASPLRRGAESIHLRYGVDVAINAGNTLYFLPTLLVERHPALTPAQKLAIHNLMTRFYVRAHFGQALDIYWSRHMQPAALQRWLNDDIGPKLLQMYAYKTAAPVIAAAETAAIIAGASAAQRRAAAAFANAFGVAFQIMDDVHNFSDSPRWRKSTGEDLADGKLTYVMARALQRLRGRERARLRAILCTPGLRHTPAAHREGLELVRRSAVLQTCRAEAETLFQAAWKRFAARVPPSKARATLGALCANLIDLRYEG